MLAGLTTCLFNHNHLPHLERGYTQAKHEFTMASKPRAVQHCVATTSNWETDTGFSHRLNNGAHRFYQRHGLLRVRHRLHSSGHGVQDFLPTKHRLYGFQR